MFQDNQQNSSDLPSRFADLKREIAASYPDFQERLTQSWAEVLQDLKSTTEKIAHTGPNYIPQVSFSDLTKLTQDELEVIKRKGCLVIRDVVEDDLAKSWKSDLEEFVKANPNVPGFPEGNKQFFDLYWTKPQVHARSHPNVLAASTWLNNFYHLKADASPEGVDLKHPLTYADRFRIRHPSNGQKWGHHPPHIDGGGIERWEDETLRKCFSDILSGNWRKHDPYDMEGRLDACTSMYGRPAQASVFRTFQGWLAMSETGPTEGTLRVFPDLTLSNTYVILRPFFRPLGSDDLLDPKNWVFDLSSPDFPGIVRHPAGGFMDPQLSPLTHPHLKLDDTMTSIPTVKPGDMVFWHCDVVHSVEQEHLGKGDSAVMYIPAVPLTSQNAAYIQRQKDSFLSGNAPPDFPKAVENYTGTAKVEDITEYLGRVAMGLNNIVEVA